MQLLPFLYPAIVALLLTPSSTFAAKKVPKDAILLSQVKTLTLRDNAKTSHRRVAAVPQLVCKGPGCSHYKVDVMRCTNQGSSYGGEDIEWSCTTSLPEEFKLGSTEVICEGYASRDDPYVLKGSCGVEYRLLLTDKGEEKYGGGYKWPGSGSEEGGSGIGKVLFMMLFVGVLGWIVYSACVNAAAPGNVAGQPRRPGGGWGGGWGGGGWGGGGGDGYDPPPPYPGKRYSSGQESWRPGFWTGAGAGAAAGYMAGRGGNRQQEPLLGNRGGSSWFGGNDNPAPRRSDSGSSSSARHESTGFGSTSRR